MASRLLSLPREVRDMISEIVIIQTDQPLRLQAAHLAAKNSLTCTSGGNLAILCKQLHAEYFSLVKRAAFSPGTTTLVAVHDFDFSPLTAFVRSLREHEIAAAKRNANFVVSLVVLDSAVLLLHDSNKKGDKAAQQSLREWARVCETTGFEVAYTAQWSALGLDVLAEMEGLIGRTREGRKILEALKGRSLRAWTWEGYQAALRCR